MQQFHSLQRLLIFYAVTLIVMLALYYTILYSELESRSQQHSVQTFNALAYDFNEYGPNVNDFAIESLVAKPYFNDISYELLFILPGGQTYIHSYTRPDEPIISTVVFPTVSTPINRRSNSAYVLSRSDLKAAIKQQSGHQLFITIRHKPTTLNWSSYTFWLPLLIAATLYLIALWYLLKRRANWRELLSYADTIGNNAKDAYRPQPFIERHSTTEFLRLGHALSRISYQLHSNYHKINTLEQRLEHLVDQAALPMLLIMRQGQISYSNKRFEHVFNVSSQLSHNYQLTDFITGVDEGSQQWLKQLSTQLVMRSLTVKSLKDKQIYQLHMTPWFDDHGQVAGFGVIFNTINDLVSKAEHLQRQNHQLQQQLNEAYKGKAIIYHELVMPLQKIAFTLNTIKPDTLLSQRLGILEDITKFSSVMSGKFSEIFNNASTQTKTLNSISAPVDIFMLGKYAVTSMNDDLRQRDIECLYFFAPNCPRYIDTDESKVKQILQNLLTDATRNLSFGYVALTIDIVSTMSPVQDRLGTELTISESIYGNAWIRFTIQGKSQSQASSSRPGTIAHTKPTQHATEHSTDHSDYAIKLEVAAADSAAHSLGGYVDFGERRKDPTMTVTTTDISCHSALYLPSRKPNYSPVYHPDERLSDLHFIAIIDHAICAEHITTLCEHLSITASIYTALDVADIMHSIEHTPDLQPIVLLDLELYEATTQQALTGRHAASTTSNGDHGSVADTGTRFTALINDPAVSTILLSRKYARLIPAPVLDQFDGFLNKPLDLSALLFEIKRIAISKKLKKTTPAASSSSLPQQAASTVHASPLVLVVEDSSTNQRIACKLLDILGYRSIVADNGIKAIEQFNNYKAEIALILMDCRMPIMDGFKATEVIRTQNSVVPVIALTANNTSEDKTACKAAGMNGFLSKPIDKDKLNAVLEQFI